MLSRAFLIIGLILYSNVNGSELIDEDEKGQVIYGCDDKILNDLNLTLKFLQFSNDNIIKKFNIMEEKFDKPDKFIFGLPNSGNGEFQALASDFSRTLQRLERKIDMGIKDLERITTENFLISSESLKYKLEQSAQRVITETLQFSQEHFERSVQIQIEDTLRRENQELLEAFERRMEVLRYYEKAPTKAAIRGMEPRLHLNSRFEDETMYVNNQPKDCAKIFRNDDELPDGVYQLYVGDLDPFKAYCVRDRIDDNGLAWTVIQKREDGMVAFNRTWKDYKNGFGNVEHDYWLGLERIHAMTTIQNYELRIDVERWEGGKLHSTFDSFVVGSNKDGYQMKELGAYAGTGGTNFENYKGNKFTTSDVDNDTWESGNCATLLKSGWWHKSCGESNINGVYNETNIVERVSWHIGNNTFHLKFAQMAIRPHKLNNETISN